MKLLKTTDGYELFPPTTHKLSKQNCDELFGIVDVKKLSKSVYPGKTNGEKRGSFIAGFNKAMALNKDKLFTLEDVKNAMDWIMTQYFEFHEQPTTGRREQYLESLQQPTEIEVEIEMEYDYNQCDGCKSGHTINDFGMHTYPNSTRAYMVCQKAKYNTLKTDSNGCITLKKI